MQNIVDTATSAGKFSSLLQAAKKAGLDLTLAGPYTVFAPTDRAFEKMPQWKLREIMADKDSLLRVLSYHVVNGSMTASDILQAGCAETTEGSLICSDIDRGVKVDNANLVQSDIRCSNGMLHVIDRVLMPN